MPVRRSEAALDEAGGRPDGAAVAGAVVEILPRALYRVRVGGAREVVAHVPSGPGRNFVRLVVGDQVTVELSRRDAGRGRIVRKR